jgi:hypothetical protein
MTSFCDVGRKGSVEVGDTVSSLFSRPKAQNVPAAASAANVSAQNDADAQTRELRRREAAARNARTRGRSLLLYDTPLGVDGGSLDPNRS